MTIPTTRTIWLWLAGTAVLMATAVALPQLLTWDVHVRWWPPLHATWRPRVGIGTPLAILVGVLAASKATVWAATASWRQLMLGSWAAAFCWLIALALVDGTAGIAAVLEHPYEYLRTARRIDDVGAALAHYVERIPYSHPHNWQVHTAGHPPGAVLFFVLLVKLGLGDGLSAGLVVTAIAATTTAGVLTTLKTLAAEQLARRAAPFLIFGPSAIWQAVSADAMFAAVAAWGLALLAVAAVRRSLGWALVSGVVLGSCVLFSYGLVLLGPLALAVLWRAGSWRPLLPACLAACAVVATYGFFGFWWWEGLTALHGRYWEGVASRRPASYWWWGNVAALCFCAGPALGASPPALAKSARAGSPVAWLAAAGWAAIVIADVSQMSRAEVERIWLPFVPWLLLGVALLPDRWQRGLLTAQICFALVLTHVLWTNW